MKFIKKNLKWITIVFFFFLFIGIGALKYFLNRNATVPVVEEPIVQEEKEEEIKEEVIATVFIDVKGAVVNPGVYEVEEGKKVIDAIHLAGGFTEQADTSLVNLAKKVTNEMVIIIYTQEEVKKAQEKDSIAKVVDNQCICPTVKNDACLNTEEKKENSKKTETLGEKVNINTASLEELQALPSIGEAKAKAIITYREEVGLFQQIEDIKEVTGIGDALYEKIKEHITV